MKNSVTFARSSVERHANIKINESQVFSMRDAFFVASRGQFISRVHVQLNVNSLQNFGFSEHPRKLPKALTRVITEIDVPIGKTARSQYVDFHTSCESPHKNESISLLNTLFLEIVILRQMNDSTQQVRQIVRLFSMYLSICFVMIRNSTSHSVCSLGLPKLTQS